MDEVNGRRYLEDINGKDYREQSSWVWKISTVIQKCTKLWNVKVWNKIE